MIRWFLNLFRRKKRPPEQAKVEEEAEEPGGIHELAAETGNLSALKELDSFWPDTDIH